jgi:hypothetical protein
MLLQMTEQQLITIGVKAFGHRYKLLRSVEQFKFGCSTNLPKLPANFSGTVLIEMQRGTSKWRSINAKVLELFFSP